MSKILILVFSFILVSLIAFWYFNSYLLPESVGSANIVGLGSVDIGETVIHPKFGKGIIKNMRSTETDDFILTIDFLKHGTKHLVASVAGLSKEN